jgi:hypothetical protein
MPFQKGNPGRPRGALNKNVAEIKALAMQSAPDAIKELKHLMKHAELEATRVAAAKELLDRGIGKATQHVEANLSIFDNMSDAEQSALFEVLEYIRQDRNLAPIGVNQEAFN